MNSIRIRLATADDETAILYLAKLESNRVGFLPRQAIRDRIASADATVAECDGRTVGYLIGRPRLKCAPWVRPVTQLVVDPDFRRRGIASNLIVDLARVAIANGQSALQAWTRVDLPAVQLWAALRFHSIAERPPRNARNRAAVLFRLPLTADLHSDFHALPARSGWKARLTDDQDLQTLLPFTDCTR